MTSTGWAKRIGAERKAFRTALQTQDRILPVVYRHHGEEAAGRYLDVVRARKARAQHDRDRIVGPIVLALAAILGIVTSTFVVLP